MHCAETALIVPVRRVMINRYTNPLKGNNFFILCGLRFVNRGNLRISRLSGDMEKVDKNENKQWFRPEPGFSIKRLKRLWKLVFRSGL
jgi:hypothetical protein